MGIVVAVALSLLPVAASASAASTDMKMREDHSTLQNCLMACAGDQALLVANAKERPQKDEDDDPAVDERPSYAHLTPSAPRKLTPSKTYNTHTIRPPDIVEFTMNYRS